MPHRDPIYDIELPIGYKLQYLLSLVPLFGLVVSCVTCVINVKRLDRSYIWTWMKFSLIPILIFCVVCPLCIYLVTTEDDSRTVFIVSTVLLSYLSIVGIAFGMVWAELKVVGKMKLRSSKEKYVEKREDD